MGTVLTVVPEMDGFFEGQLPPNLVKADYVVIGGLEGGMHAGNPSVSIIAEVRGGPIVLAETSLKLFLDAADILRKRYGDPRVEPAGPAA